MSSQKPIRHLPLLYNPLLNCLFNNPNHNKQPFKSIIEEFSRNHNDYTILVPPAYIFHECYDPVSQKSLLREQCYNNEDFIRSHILKTSTSYSSTITPISKTQLVIYNTTNGKQVLIKNGMVFTGKGFKKSLKLKVLSIGYFDSFSDYFPTGSRFMLIYIEDTIIGSFTPSHPENTERTESPKPLPQKEIVDTITFEKLLRSFPLLSQAVSDNFYRLFHHNNNQFRLLQTNTRKKLIQIKGEFQNILEEAYKNILDSVKEDSPTGEQTYNLLNHILRIYPGLDLNRLVHEYVELNLYDKLWAQLIFQFNCSNDDKLSYDKEAIKILSPQKYNSLSCLALNQLDIPVYTPWDLNLLQERVSRGIIEFSKLSDALILNLNAKTKIILDTVNILTESSGNSEKDVIVSADTLIGLLIMVIVHCKIENLEAHLYYVKHFNSVDFTNDGHFNYIMSNLDAVLYHLSASSDEQLNLLKSSQDNFDFWSAIQNKDSLKLNRILALVQEEYPQELPQNHFLKSCNINGENCLMFAIKSGSFDIYDKILNTNENWFTVEELLFSKNISTNQNLLIVALSEEAKEISEDLAEFIVANASVEEQIAYFNSVDKSGRSTGHYLFHNYRLIESIGHLIDWELRDLNSHTPMFSLCRCYDHIEYSTILNKAFACIYQKYGSGKLNFDRHVDKSGNTLLHIILKNIPETELLSKKSNLININQENFKHMTPLTLYIKYNRVENLRELLQDNRLEFMYEDRSLFYNVFDYLGFVASKVLSHRDFDQLEKPIFSYFMENYFPKSCSYNLAALNAKYDPNKQDWVVFFKDTEGFSNYKSLKSIKQIFYIAKLEAPFSLLPDEDTLWLNYATNKQTTPSFHKHRINKFIEGINLVFNSLTLQDSFNLKGFFRKFLMQEESKENLTLELIKNVNNTIEAEKNKLGEVAMTFNQIQEIEVFLSYSATDLNSYKHVLVRLNKLLCMCAYKQSDIRAVFDTAVARFLPQALKSSLDTFKRDEDSRYLYLFQFTVMLETFVNNILKCIIKLLEKTRAWKESYHHIKELNVELKKFEGKPLENGGVQSPTRRGTFNLDFHEDPEEESTSFFNFTGLVEVKKSKYKRLIVAKADKVKQIVKLNTDIKWEHEQIAAEISNFLKARLDFLRFGFRQYTQRELVRYRHRQFELAKVLNSVRNGCEK